jgi:hypothetical protein
MQKRRFDRVESVIWDDPHIKAHQHTLAITWK